VNTSALTSLAMLLRASSSAEKRSLTGARFRPDPGVPMSAATPQLNKDQLASRNILQMKTMNGKIVHVENTE